MTKLFTSGPKEDRCYTTFLLTALKRVSTRSELDHEVQLRKMSAFSRLANYWFGNYWIGDYWMAITGWQLLEWPLGLDWQLDYIH
jgi:hypothetical protein